MKTKLLVMFFLIIFLFGCSAEDILSIKVVPYTKGESHEFDNYKYYFTDGRITQVLIETSLNGKIVTIDQYKVVYSQKNVEVYKNSIPIFNLKSSENEIIEYDSGSTTPFFLSQNGKEYSIGQELNIKDRTFFIRNDNDIVKVLFTNTSESKYPFVNFQLSQKKDSKILEYINKDMRLDFTGNKAILIPKEPNGTDSIPTYTYYIENLPKYVRSSMQNFFLYYMIGSGFNHHIICLYILGDWRKGIYLY